MLQVVSINFLFFIQRRKGRGRSITKPTTEKDTGEKWCICRTADITRFMM